MSLSANYLIFTDGGASGNPGPAAGGVIIKTEKGQVLAKISKLIGNTTNNDAEYRALISALEYLLANRQKLNTTSQSEINFYSDSNLMVNQVNGLYKVKNSRLREFIYRIREMEMQISANIYYRLIPREKNQEADALVNEALDKMF